MTILSYAGQRRRTHVQLLLGLLLTLTSPICMAQVRVRDEVDGFELMLPSSAWIAMSLPSTIYTHTDFVYGKTSTVRLRIRRTLNDVDTPSAIARRDRQMRLRFLPGFISDGTESFVGKLDGVRVRYEYIRGGKLVSVETYYLQSSASVIYVLRFSGPPELLERIRNQTDFIARSFRLT